MLSPVECPLIGIDGHLDGGDPPRASLPTRYADAVLKAGGIPVVIPPVGGPSDIARVLDRVDGLLLPGGDDFDTARLGLGPTHPAACPVPAEKQDFDVALARAALERRLPVLGICYGMQLLALATGGSLLQHLPDDRPGGRDHRGGVEHAVEIRPGTKLARLLDLEELPVVSRHHQAIDEPGAGWLVSATDDEGLVEALESTELPFALGVQWHPELAPEGSPHDRLFRGLVGAASLHAARAHSPAVATAP